MKGRIESLFKPSQEKSSRDFLVCLRLRTGVDLERIVGSSALGCSEIRQKAVCLCIRVEYRSQPLMPLGSRPAGFSFRHSVRFLLVQLQLGQSIGCFVGFIGEAQIFCETLTRILRKQGLNHLPVSLFLVGLSTVDPRFTDAAKIAFLESVLEALRSSTDGRIHLKGSDSDFRGTLRTVR